MLVIISIILSSILHWQHFCYQQIRQQNLEVQRNQQGFALLSTLIGLLLMSLSLLALVHLSTLVFQTRNDIDDLLQQNRTAILFYFTLQPYVERIGYSGCNSTLALKESSMQIYLYNDPKIPSLIQAKTHSPILYLKQAAKKPYFISKETNTPHYLSLQNVEGLHIGDDVALNNCQQLELHRITEINKLTNIIGFQNTIQMFLPDFTDIHRLEECWFYIAKTPNHYPNQKPIQALYRACDHQPIAPELVGVESWNIHSSKEEVIFEFQTESSTFNRGQSWQSHFKLVNGHA